MKTKTWEVKVPITGYCVVRVAADDEESAIWEAVCAAKTDDLDRWQAIPQIVEGNRFYGMLNEAEAKEVSGE